MRVWRVRIGLKTYVKMTKSLRLRIRKGGEVMFGNEKIYQVNNFTYKDSVISTDGGCGDKVKSRVTKAWSFFLTVERSLEE